MKQPQSKCPDSAQVRDLARCHHCGLAMHMPYDCEQDERHTDKVYCPRCDERVHYRKPHSIQKTWAFLIAATLMLYPANFLPINLMTVPGGTQPDTIMSGVISLINNDNVAIGIIVFIASILVPVFKIIGIGLILISIQTGLQISHAQRMLLFKVIDWIGRWSIMDLFVISIMVAVLHHGNLLTVIPGPAATAFGAVVVLTLFAAKSFDTRLMWDMECDDEWKRPEG